MKQQILLKPIISEKTLKLALRRQYTFRVRLDANKKEIGQIIKKLYKVDPIDVKILNAKPVLKRRRRFTGKTSHIKKAIVFIKQGQKIPGYGLEEEKKDKKDSKNIKKNKE
jgi:large subunit ribosomal protein L23